MTCKLLPAERRNILFTARGERQVDNGASITEKGVKYKMPHWMSVMRPGPGCHSWGWQWLPQCQAGPAVFKAGPHSGLVSWNIDQSQSRDQGRMTALLCNIITTSPCITQLEHPRHILCHLIWCGEGRGIQSTCNYLEERFVQLSFGW